MHYFSYSDIFITFCQEKYFYFFFKMAIKIAGSDLQTRVGWDSGNTGLFRPEREFSLDPPLPVVIPFFH